MKTNFQQAYRHASDPRSKDQILLSNLITRALTQSNLQRISEQKITKSSQKSIKSQTHLRKQDFLYVCFNGIPPYQDQFDHLGLPGEVLTIQLQACQFGLTEEQTKQKIKYAKLEDQSQKVDQEINKRSKTKPLVIVFHSFGTYIASAYLHLYGGARVVGMIDIGGSPIRMYPSIKNNLMRGYNMGMEYITENIKKMYEDSVEFAKKNKVGPLRNQYQAMSYFITLMEGLGFTNMYEFIRNWPSVLKCFIYGRKDSTILQKNLSEKAVYYCYKMPFKKEYEQGLIKQYKEKYDRDVANIQERFIYNIEDGVHSLHLQKKNRLLLKNIIHQYLDFLEVSVVHPKL